MKARLKHVKDDSLCVDHKGRTISIHTHRQTIVLTASNPATKEWVGHEFTFDQLYQRIASLRSEMKEDES